MLHHRSSLISVAAGNWPTLAASSALLWAYWPTLATLRGTWSVDPRYSHGFLVPIFSLYLWWSRRGRAAGLASRPSPWGIVLIGLGIAMHLGGGAANQDWIEAASLLPSLAGLYVMARGWAALKLNLAPIAFLAFMIPLPYRVELAIGAPLQRLATHASAILLQVSGLPALEAGNTIALGRETIGIVEACNGLSMLTFFLAISAGLALCARTPWVERALIVAGAIPIALIANIARITATGLLVERVGHGVAGLDFHDLAGYLMMPFAVALLCVENALISGLFRDDVAAVDGDSRRTPALAPAGPRFDRQPAGLMAEG